MTDSEFRHLYWRACNDAVWHTNSSPYQRTTYYTHKKNRKKPLDETREGNVVFRLRKVLEYATGSVKAAWEHCTV